MDVDKDDYLRLDELCVTDADGAYHRVRFHNSERISCDPSGALAGETYIIFEGARWTQRPGTDNFESADGRIVKKVKFTRDLPIASRP